jgi:lysozyme
MPALDLAAALVKRFEACRLVAYRDPAGVWTIGWGHTGSQVQGGLTWSQDRADHALAADLCGVRDRVLGLVRQTLTEPQLGALVSFTFNIGAARLQTSLLLRRLNQGDRAGAADQFLVWDKAHVKGVPVVLPGLAARRAAERALFLS